MGIDFSIKGYVESSRHTMDSNSEEDFELLLHLRKREEEIRSEILDGVRNLLPENEVKVELDFFSGSVGFDIFVSIVQSAATLGSAISFLDYLSRFLGFITRRAIERRVRGRYLVRISEVRHYTSGISLEEPNRVFGGFSEISKALNRPAGLILAMTLLNFVLFFGGNIYNLFQIESVAQQSQSVRNLLIQEHSQRLQAIEGMHTAERRFSQELDDALKRLESEYLETVSSESEEAQRRLHQLQLRLADAESAASDHARAARELKSEVDRIHWAVFVRRLKVQQGDTQQLSLGSVWSLLDWSFKTIIISALAGGVLFLFSLLYIVISMIRGKA